MNGLFRLFLRPLPLLLLLVTLLTGGVVAHAQAAINEITIEQDGAEVTAPAEIPAGMTGVTLHNKGQGPGGITLARLREGVTMEEVGAAAAGGDVGAAMGMLYFVGGPGAVSPGSSARTVIDLAEGMYLLIDPVAENPVLGTLAVVAAEGEMAAAPASDSTVGLFDFAFELPDAISAGAQSWQVENKGEQLHEILLLKLDEGASVEDVLAFMENESPQGPPPFAPAGGASAMQVGESNWVDLEFDTGTYLAICFVPDQATGQPHFALGMMATFSVTGEEAVAESEEAAPTTLPETGTALPPVGQTVVGMAALLLLAMLVLRAWRQRVT